MENAEARRRFDEQFTRCYRYIFRYIVALVPDRADADDVFQETSLAILQSWQDYDSTRPMVPWVCGIARNVVRNFYNRRRRGTFLSEEAIAAFSLTQHRLSAQIDRRLQELPDCLQKLTAEQRALLERCYGQRGSIKATAEAKQLDPNVLYKQLERIRRTLFECLEQSVPTE